MEFAQDFLGLWIGFCFFFKIDEHENVYKRR